MASLADARDIFGIGPLKVGESSKPKLVKKSKPKKSDGISRELYSLLGDNAPPLTLALPKIKDKPKLQRKAQHWHLASFTNQARNDSLQLRHWAPKPMVDDAAVDYKFAAFNTASPVFSYTPDEYNRLLQAEPEWTKQETDYLFALCKAYDLRFIVISDRYSYPNSARSLEDLKDRYYSCSRRLINARPTSDETIKNQQTAQYSFDRPREIARKKYLRSLISRTPAQILEEESLYVESRRLEQTYTRTMREREDLLRMLGGPGSGATTVPNSSATLPPGSIQLGPSGNLMGAGAALQRNALTQSRISRRTSGRGGSMLEDEESLPATPAPVGGKGKRGHIVDAHFDDMHNITRFEPPPTIGVNSFGLPKAAINRTGAYLRSTRLPPIKAILQPKVHAVLAELHISQRLIMPTRTNADKLEALVGAVGTLCELKRQVDRIEYELGVANARTVESIKEGDFAAPEDLDESERTKRSMSVSSTASARPNKKRKK